DNKAAVINKTNDEEDDEFVHTLEDYVPTNDEDFNDEEFDRINKEMYSDVNVELKDLQRKGEGKDDEEMTDPSHEDVEHENVSQEVAGDQDKDETQATATVALATQKTEVPLQSSSILSDYASKFLNFDNIPSGETKIISMMDVKVQHEDPSIHTSPLLTIPVFVIPESSTAPTTTITSLLSSIFPNLQQLTPILTPTTTKATTSTTVVPDPETLSAIYQRLSDIENEVKTLRNVDHSSTIRA
ncbi:hypothetical protein Tco_0219470, partial [Tanacetum coccineum]